jgi:hypothetical protein
MKAASAGEDKIRILLRRVSQRKASMIDYPMMRYGVQKKIFTLLNQEKIG